MHPVFETDRLILRPPQLEDEMPLKEAINRSLPALQRWMPWAADPSFEPTMRLWELVIYLRMANYSERSRSPH